MDENTPAERFAEENMLIPTMDVDKIYVIEKMFLNSIMGRGGGGGGIMFINQRGPAGRYSYGVGRGGR
jgi:hypothetical protein